MLLNVVCYTLMFCTLQVVNCDFSPTSTTDRFAPTNINNDNVNINSSISEYSLKIRISCDVDTNNDEGELQKCSSSNQINGYCFYFMDNFTSYRNAYDECTERGMELASITEPAILDYITNVMINQIPGSVEKLYWIDIPYLSWRSMENWTIEFNEYFTSMSCSPNPTDAYNKEEVNNETKTCHFIMGKTSKSVVRDMESQALCEWKLKFICQGKIDLSQGHGIQVLTSQASDTLQEPSYTIIIIASGTGLLFLLIVFGCICRSLHKAAGSRSHKRMDTISKSDTIPNEDSEKRTSMNAYDEPDKQDDEEAAYAVLDDDDDDDDDEEGGAAADAGDVDHHQQQLPQCTCSTEDPTTKPPTEDSEEPCYFTLEKQPSVESLQHTYEDCAFTDGSTLPNLPSRSNPHLTQGFNGDNDENVYDWPDLLQPTDNTDTLKTRRTQSQTEPAETENIYDSIYPIEAPTKRFHTKHLSLQRKKHNNKHKDNKKQRGSRKGLTSNVDSFV